MFTTGGTYRLQVGSFRDYLDGYKADEVHGVAKGLSYQMNVSLQNHDTNPSLVGLPGKTLTVIQGAGLGGSARITAYDPETNLYTLDADLGTLDSTSQYEISYTMLEEFGGYPTRTDSYTVVLTAPPAAGETVTVDVTPEITRTYNADLAFTAGKGQRDAVQVTVDKAV